MLGRVFVLALCRQRTTKPKLHDRRALPHLEIRFAPFRSAVKLQYTQKRRAAGVVPKVRVGDQQQTTQERRR